MHFGLLKYLSELISFVPIEDTGDESGKHLCAYLKKASATTTIISRNRKVRVEPRELDGAGKGEVCHLGPSESKQ